MDEWRRSLHVISWSCLGRCAFLNLGTDDVTVSKLTTPRALQKYIKPHFCPPDRKIVGSSSTRSIIPNLLLSCHQTSSSAFKSKIYEHFPPPIRQDEVSPSPAHPCRGCCHGRTIEPYVYSPPPFYLGSHQAPVLTIRLDGQVEKRVPDVE